MATLFWVGGSTAYDGVTNRLATSSGGSATVAAIAAGDTVTFDGSSPAGAVVTTSAAIGCTTLTLNTGFTGSLTMSNALTVSGATVITQGGLNINGQAWSTASLNMNNSNTKALTLGASVVTVSGTGSSWTVVATGTTFSAASSTITFTGAAPAIAFGTGLTYGSIVINSSGISQTDNSITCANFTRTGTAVKTSTLTINSGAITVTGTCTFGGNTTQGVNRLFVNSNLTGTQRTITAAAYVISGDVDFQDINLAYSGAASWTNAGSAFVGDSLGNSAVVTANTTTPATQTATGTASFTWSTHGWTSRVPLPQDDVVISNSFIAGRTITADMPRLGKSIDMSGATGSPAFSAASTHTSYGSWAFASGMTDTGGATRNLFGRGTHTITSNSVNLGRPATIGGPGGTYTLQDDLSLGNSNLTVISVSGTFNANNKNVSAQAVATVAGSTGTLNMGNGTWTMLRTAAGNVWNIASTVTVNAGLSEIIVSAVSANARVFIGGGQTYNILTYTVAGSTGSLTLNEGNTFNTINFSDVTNARSLLFTAGTTTTVTNWNVNGTAGKLMTVDSVTAATHTLSPVGPIESSYLSVNNSIVGNGQVGYAHKSTNVSGNTNWVFLDDDFVFNNYEFVKVGDGMSVGGDKIR